MQTLSTKTFANEFKDPNYRITQSEISPFAIQSAKWKLFLQQMGYHLQAFFLISPSTGKPSDPI